MTNIEFIHNKRFEDLFNPLNIKNLKVESSEGLKKLLKDGFKEKDGCIYYKRYVPEGPISSDLIDKTGNEVFYNKIQIDDFSSHFENIENVHLREGISFALTLADKLILIKGDFNIYVIYDEVYCTIVFHKRRPNEYWLIEDLNQYKNDAILLVKITS